MAIVSVPISDIFIAPDRQRKSFDPAAIIGLAQSIIDNGLINPVTVEAGGEKYSLIAGERRLRALKLVPKPYRHNNCEVPVGFVPIVFNENLTPDQREAMELAENLDREQLTWQETINAQARIHQLRERQAEARGEVQTFKATAIELAGDKAVSTLQQEIRNATILKPFMNDPEVKSAKTEKEAMNIVRKKLTQEFNVALASKFDLAGVKSNNRLIIGDCAVEMAKLDAGSFDVIIADPPYGINADKMTPMSGSQSGQVHEYEDSFENAVNIWIAIAGEGFRVCKIQAHLYMFCDFRNFHSISDILKHQGWSVWPTPIIWYKPSGGMLGDSAHGPRKAYETIIFASKGEKCVQAVYFDVITANPADSTLHAAAKPVEVYDNLLRRSVIPGDRILDPCCGSGTIFPAGNRRRVVAFGIESSPIHAALAASRINGED